MRMKEVLISEEKIQSRVAEMAAELKHEYEGKNPLILCVLKGSLIFTADLVRKMDIPLEIDFIQVSSYGNGTTSSGEPVLKKVPSIDLKDRHVIVVEDILDTGATLRFLMKKLIEMQPASLKLCTFIDKPERRKVQIEADYVGYKIPNCFIVGYGLDCAEQFRGLPYIGILEEDE
ncbi:MAG: hypoxanthine phosphoribosyltransferase [Ruminococcaceae bacterium]|nr:hypoxanthine phosphoribosyltransferase [Oscillospiraceae bacterium]